MAEFSMELNEDQKQLQDWIHGFAVNVMRPAAAEWDEREETPWPIIEQASKLGIYGLDFLANAFSDPTGLSMMIFLEEMAWGDAGLCMAIVGSSLAVAGLMSNGTPEQQMEWIPQCYGTPEDIKLGAFCVSEPDAGSDVSALRTRAVYDEATDEWVLNGTKTWITNGGIANTHVVVASVDPSLRFSWSGFLRRGRRHQGHPHGTEVQEDGYPCLAHGRGHPRRLPRPWSQPARRQGEAR
jgi:alkylation response protein AidB-like acyl-CoA dehydrogenase